MKRAVALLVVMAGGASQAEERAGLSMLRLPLSVRQTGMGDVAAGGTDVLAAWGNPAWLGALERRGELAVTGMSMFAGQQVTGGAGGAWRLGDRLSVGCLARYHSVSVPEVDELGNDPGGSLTQQTWAATAAGAFRFGPATVGVAIKRIVERIDGDGAAAFAVDGGAIASAGRLMVAAVYRNAGRRIRATDPAAPASVVAGLPAETAVSVSYAVRQPRIVVGAEQVLARGFGGRAGAGVEWWPGRDVAVRGGVTGLGEPDGTRFTCGLTGRYRGLGLDYSLATHPLGALHRVSMSWAFGSEPVVR